MALIEFPSSPQNKYAQRVVGNRRELIYFVQGKCQGRDAWHYIEVEKSRLLLFERQLKSGTIDLKQFGTILYSGWGRIAPVSVQEELLESLAG